MESDNWCVIFTVFDTRSGEWIRNITHFNLSESDAKKYEMQYNDDVIKYQWDDNFHKVVLDILQSINIKKIELTNSTSDMD